MTSSGASGAGRWSPTARCSRMSSTTTGPRTSRPARGESSRSATASRRCRGVASAPRPCGAAGPRGVPPHCDSLHHGRGPINYRPMTKPTTLGELKQTEWASPARIHRTVKDELRENLICLLENGSPLFPGIVGYEDSVIPQLVNAVLSRHNFILLGLRGQAKSRILRQLVTLLDDEIPILAGSEVNDNPFAPISKYGRELVVEQDARTPIAWLPRESRFVEKLATPDVTIADIIGDVDPIKAARGGHLLSDELTMHFGLLPRANRGIFAINELPDLAGKIQVGLFNIMQEGD